MTFSEFSVRRPIAVCMLFLGVMVIGVTSLLSLPVELLPNINQGDISIIIQVRGGMPPAEVEELVTRPVEEAVSTVSHLRNIVSNSKKGESQVMLEFEPGTDMNFAALEVREKFALVKDKLPREIEKPIIAQYKKSDSPIVILAATGTHHSPELLRRIVDENVQEKLQRVEGVANVDVFGGQERKILVEVDQQRLQAYALSIDRVVAVLGLNNLDFLAGDVESKRKTFLVRTMGAFDSLEEIRSLGVAATPSGSLIRLEDVATVRDSYLEPESLARVDVEPVVSLYVYKESTANTVAVGHGIKDELGEILPELPPGVEIEVIGNQGDAIEEAITTVRNALWLGAGLAVVVLLVFLRHWRSTFIVASTIPTSVMATFALMYLSRTLWQTEFTLNIMTLSGLALGIGMLVDNSIVVLENIFKHRQSGKGEILSAMDGSHDVLMAITASTITTIVVFVPFVFVSEEIRMLWSGLALTVTFSLVSSLFVATSLVPMLSAHNLGPVKERIVTQIRRWHPSRLYRRLSIFVLRYRYLLVMDVLLIFALVIFFGATNIDKEFVVAPEEGRFTIYVDLDPGANLNVTDIMVADVEELLETVPEIKNFSSRIEPASSRIHVRLVPLAERERDTEAVIEDLREMLAEVESRYKGGFIYFSEIKESGFKELTMDLYGYDYQVLKELANSMAERMGTVPGMQDLRMSRIEGRPEWGVAVDPSLAASYDIMTRRIAELLHAHMRGLRATRYHTDGTEVETVVRLQPRYRETLDQLRKLTLVTSGGMTVYLEQLAEFVPNLVPGEIIRKNKNRLIHVSATVVGMSLEGAVKQVRSALADMQFPKNYFYRVGGNYYQDIENQQQLMQVLGLTLILVFMVLASLFESYLQPFLIMMTVPMASIGVVIALHVTDQPISRGVFIGAIMLAGIVVNNAIVLVDHVNALLDRGWSLARALVRGGQDRLRPILMTTATTVFGLVPLATDKSESANLWSPLAITVIGGLLSATLLTLFVLPALYAIFADVGGIMSRIIDRLSPARAKQYQYHLMTQNS